MPELFKPDRPHKLPADAQVLDVDGRPHAKIRERGRTAVYPLTKDGTRYLKPGAKWAADVRHADGTRKRERFSTDRAASEMMLGDLLRRIEHEKAGAADPTHRHRGRPLAELLGEYERHHRDRENTDKQGKQARRRCELVFAGCGAVRLGDLDATAAAAWLAERRRGPRFGPQTFNHYVAALRAFGHWLVKARRAPANPFEHLATVNAALDVRHARRQLLPDELVRVLAAAAAGPADRGLSGPDRRMLYLVAAYTGLRASELASLSPESFALAGDPPAVTVAAAYSKHKVEDVVPLHQHLVAELAPWLARRPAGEPLWPGKWAKQFYAAVMLRRDLAAARAAWLAEAAADEQGERERSDFLAYQDAAGGFADFHALRHTFITNLVNAGVQPKDAKELARHSTITLTMDRYAHVGIRDTAAAVAKLPAIAAAGAAPGAAPGAAGGAAAGGGGRGPGRAGEETGPGGGPPPTARPPGRKSLAGRAVEGGRGPARAGSLAEREGFELPPKS